MLHRWLKEPLLHFLIAGALLFAGYAYINRDRDDGDRVVRITASEVAWLKESWTRQWQREPSDAELRGLVADYLKESLLAREAGELGLDQNDIIVRRRLAQKMEFLIRDTASLAEPDSAALRRLYDAEPGRFRTPALVSFEQIYFETEAAARRHYARLGAGHDVGPGETTLLEREYTGADRQAVAAVFGPEFADALLPLTPGGWHGPLASSYGFHIVRVNAREEGRARSFEEVRGQLADERQRQEQAEADEKFFASLLDKYDVVVDESVRPLLGSIEGTAR